MNSGNGQTLVTGKTLKCPVLFFLLRISRLTFPTIHCTEMHTKYLKPLYLQLSFVKTLWSESFTGPVHN